MDEIKSDYQKETGLESLPMRVKKANERDAKILKESWSSNRIIVKKMNLYTEKGK